MMYGYLYNCRVRRDMDVAMRYYEKALEVGKETREHCWFQTHQQISLLMNMRGQGNKAVERWKAWLEQEPDNVQALLSVIWALYHANRSEEALPFLKRAERLDPDNPSVMTAMGDVLGGERGLGRYEEAIGYWDKAINLCDDYGDARFSKAYAYEQLGQYRLAIHEYQEICKWLAHRGYDIGVEAQYPEEKIRELTQKLETGKKGPLPKERSKFYKQRLSLTGHILVISGLVHVDDLVDAHVLTGGDVGVPVGVIELYSAGEEVQALLSRDRSAGRPHTRQFVRSPPR